MRWVWAFLFCVTSSVSFAKLKTADKVKVSSEVKSWTSRMTKDIGEMKTKGEFPAEGYGECSETEEIDGAFLCAYSDGLTMNRAFARATLYIEGGFSHPKGTVSAFTSGAMLQGLQFFAGHDLTSVHLQEFFKKAEEACKVDKAMCLNSQEQELYDEVVEPLSRKRKDFVLVTYAVSGHVGYMEVVTHEILHAQYFMDRAFRTIADEFWEKEVTEDDKQVITRALAGYYDVKDKLLLRNEFQAYLLMAGADRFYLYSVVPKYRPKLMKKLEDAGIKPIQVK